MTLYDVLKTAKYYQVYHVYLFNDWDDNIMVGRGTRAELLAQERDATKDEYMVFDYLNNEVEMLHCIGSVIIISLKSDEYNVPVNTIWSDDTIEWDKKRPLKDRKFLSSTEMDQIAKEWKDN